MQPGQCNVCSAALGEAVYRSLDNASITTMNKIIPGRTEVFFCERCGHLQTTALPDLDAYYANEYEINLASEDDDQLYKVVDGCAVYRAEHQASVLLKKLAFGGAPRVLDYGCAKAPTLRKVAAAHPAIVPFAFDVTDKYVPAWQRFIEPGHWAAHEIPGAWNATIDIVLSFYALEHVRNPLEFLRTVRGLLRPGGTFYFVVPNAYANVADFVVADHVNHFSEPSLRTLLGLAGFETIEVDARSHDAAFVVVARKLAQPALVPRAPAAVDELRLQAGAMAKFWSEAGTRVRAFEAGLPPATRRAIYGAGFYGNFIASALKSPQQIECFVDQNAHLAGRQIHGKPIVAPAALDPAIDTVLVGLNPQQARSVIDAIAAWRDKRFNFLFL
jgi:SAM-dependent methyltransferase